MEPRLSGAWTLGRAYTSVPGGRAVRRYFLVKVCQLLLRYVDKERLHHSHVGHWQRPVRRAVIVREDVQTRPERVFPAPVDDGVRGRVLSLAFDQVFTAERFYTSVFALTDW